MTLEKCPNCGSEEVSVKKKGYTWKCDDCGKCGILRQNEGLEELIEQTCNSLNTFVRTAFIGAQKHCIDLKDREAAAIITKYMKQVGAYNLEAKMLVMTIELSALWQYHATAVKLNKSFAQGVFENSFLRFWEGTLYLFNKATVPIEFQNYGIALYRVIRVLGHLAGQIEADEYSSITSVLGGQQSKPELYDAIAQKFYAMLEFQYKNMKHEYLNDLCLVSLLKKWTPCSIEKDGVKPVNNAVDQEIGFGNSNKQCYWDVDTFLGFIVMGVY